MANKIYGSNNEPLKVQVITDVHYYSRKLGPKSSIDIVKPCSFKLYISAIAELSS